MIEETPTSRFLPLIYVKSLRLLFIISFVEWIWDWLLLFPLIIEDIYVAYRIKVLHDLLMRLLTVFHAYGALQILSLITLGLFYLVNIKKLRLRNFMIQAPFIIIFLYFSVILR
jgi:hypothetical protein